MTKFPRLVTVFFAFATMIGFAPSSQAQLIAGDIMFVGFNTDNPDGFAIVALNAIPAGSIIYFSDNNWNGTTFAATEGVLTWTVGAAIPAGNVIIFDNVFPGPPVVNFGSATVAGSVDLAGGGESLYCYLGATPTSFLSVITNNNFTSSTLTGTGLTVGVNAISFSGNPDVLVYNNSTAPCMLSISACASQIADITNWITDDGVGNQATDGNMPDFPFSVLAPPVISVLPIELLSFLAQSKENDEVLLTWQTASERNNDYFEVEKRTNDQEWSVLSRIKGAGNSTDLKTYRLTDESAFLELTYYRLSQVDFDGQREYFDILSVQPDTKNGTLLCFPNPSTGEFYLHGGNLKEKRIQIQDYLGRDVTSQAGVIIKDKNIIFIQAEALLSGTYILSVGEEKCIITIL